MSQPSAQSGPPYLPTTASVGGRPTLSQDIPACAVFLALYLVGAVCNMTIFQLNRRRGHKFILSGLMFGFCMSRIATMVLRIAWATHLSNASLAIASQIFQSAGILIVYVVNLLLAQRVLRAKQPRFGWHGGLGWIFKVMYVLIGLSLALVISFTVLSFYTLDMGLRSAAGWVQKGALTYILVFACAPVVLLLLAGLLPKAEMEDRFGVKGSLRSQVLILSVSTFFAVFIAGFREGSTWAPARPASDPAWYQSKAAFFVFNFTFEIIIIYLFILTRFDLRFWVPNGSSAPGHYSQRQTLREKEVDADSSDETA